MFCYHATLKKLSDLERCTLINLFCIASESRFAEVLQSNLLEDEPSGDLFNDKELILRAEQAIELRLQS